MWGRLSLVLLLAASTWGCGARREYYLAGLDVGHDGWDTLRVGVDFAWRTALGAPHPLEPDTVVITVLDARYRTLYSGSARRIPVPDGELGDREALLVEVCGTVGGRSICVQEQEWASPKRLHVDEDITYPEGGDYDRGRYDFAFRVERRRFDATGWEPVRASPEITGYLLASVEAHEDAPVKVPFTQRRGRFDLARHDNYRDFRYYLEARLLDAQQARVRFDVYAGIRGQPERVASVEKEVALKTKEARAVEVRAFAEQATDRLVDALSGAFFRGRRAVAYVDDWRYDAGRRGYGIDMEVEWRSGLFRGERFALEGTLEVGEDGKGARFRLRSGNRDGERRWERHVDGDVLSLGDLHPPAPEPLPEAPEPPS